MAIGLNFVLTGNRELDAAFKELPRRIEKKVLRQALRPAAKIIEQEAESHAPVLSGQGKKSIKVRAGKRSRKRPDAVSIVVITEAGFFQGKTFYMAFQELGWRHGSRKLGNARKVIAGLAFIRNALKTKGEQAKEVAMKLIVEGIEREATQLSALAGLGTVKQVKMGSNKDFWADVASSRIN